MASLWGRIAGLPDVLLAALITAVATLIGALAVLLAAAITGTCAIVAAFIMAHGTVDAASVRADTTPAPQEQVAVCATPAWPTDPLVMDGAP